MDVQIRSSAGNHLQTLVHVSAGQLIVREYFNPNHAIGTLFHVLLEQERHSGIVGNLCSVTVEQQRYLIVSVLCHLSAVLLRTAGQGNRAEQGQHQGNCNQFSSLQFFLLRRPDACDIPTTLTTSGIVFFPDESGYHPIISSYHHGMLVLFYEHFTLKSTANNILSKNLFQTTNLSSKIKQNSN